MGCWSPATVRVGIHDRIRIPSRKLLAETCQAAAVVGATAVIVHGGHGW